MAHLRAHSQVCTTTLHDPLSACRRRRTTQRRRARFGRHRGAGLSPSTEHRSAGHATPGSERAASRAAPVGGTARAATLGTFTTATQAQSHGHLRPGRWSPVSLRRGSRPSRGSAALALPTRGFSAGTAGGTARHGSHMPAPPALPWCRMSPCRAAARLSMTFSRTV